MSYLLSCSVCCWHNTGRFLQQQRLDGKIRRRKGTVSRANMESPSQPIIHRRAVCATQAVRDFLYVLYPRSAWVRPYPLLSLVCHLSVLLALFSFASRQRACLR